MMSEHQFDLTRFHEYRLLDVVALARKCSKREARHLIRSGAVTFRNERVEDEMKQCKIPNGSLLRVGRMTFRTRREPDWRTIREIDPASEEGQRFNRLYPQGAKCVS